MDLRIIALCIHSNQYGMQSEQQKISTLFYLPTKTIDIVYSHANQRKGEQQGMNKPKTRICTRNGRHGLDIIRMKSVKFTYPH